MKKLVAICLAMGLLLAINGVAQASFFDFESEPAGINYYADPGGTAARSTEQALSGNYSVKLAIPDTENWARFYIPFNAQLGKAAATFMAYIPSGSPANLAPYAIFDVDSNQNGIWDPAADSQVIAFITGSGNYPTNTWFQTGLNSSTNVHVVGDRSGLLDTEFSSSHGGGLMSDLYLKTFSGSTTWGDLEVMNVRIGIGLTGPDGNIVPYTAYVDNVSATPVPGTVLLLGSGLAGLVIWRRRRASLKA